MYSDDGRIAQFRSIDGGLNWIDEGFIWDGSKDTKPFWYAPVGVTLLSDGRVALTGFRIHRPTPQTPTCNDATGACLPEETVLFFSKDGGRSWSSPILIQKPDGVHLEAYGSVLPLKDGRWVHAFDVTKAYDDPSPLGLRVAGLISGDEGSTWTGPFPIAGAPGSEKTFWHLRLTRLDDGRLLGFPWTGDATGQNFLPLHRVEGNGLHWQPPVPTNLPGQTNCPVQLQGAQIAIAYTVRGGESPGIYVALSEDEGRSWDLQSQIQVWDAYGRESLGVPRTASYPSSHDNIAFGAPNLLRLSSTEMIASFWATIGGQTICRAVRIAMDNKREAQ